MTLRTLWSELKAYPRGVLEEMRKVSWPDASSTRRLTVVVVVVVGVAAVVIGAMDFVFSRLAAIVLGL